MALTDEEKVEALQRATIDYFNSLTTIADWVDFVNTVTKTKVKNFLQNAIEAASDNYDSGSTDLSTKAADYDALSAQIGAL